MSEKYLGLETDDLLNLGGLITAREIEGQPALWAKVYDTIFESRKIISDFMKSNSGPSTKIILTGAGSSAFIGNALQGSFTRSFNCQSAAIATTDLITHPYDYLIKGTHHLIISFARSGDSPESIGAADLIDQICPGTSHIIITCNKNGKLVNNKKGSSVLPIVLPPESNDQGLAMTGSFTSMLLAGLLISKISRIDTLKSSVDRICYYGDLFLKKYLQQLTSISKIKFKRAVFLGSGPLLGCAIESHLKLQELTDGNVLCKYDSYLGLRHGPKAVINSETLVVNLLSNNPFVNKYEMDLIADIVRLPSAAFLVISESEVKSDLVKNKICTGKAMDLDIDEDFLSVCFVVPAQIIGFFKGVNLNIPPDSPSLNGSVSRVVTGVHIYPYNY